MGTKENKTVKIVLAVLIGILVLVLAGMAFIMVRGRMQEGYYTAAIEEAEKYAALNNYEQAILQYEEAISLDSEKEEAYLSLASIYEEQENTSRAMAVLRKGYEKTKSVRIKKRIDQLGIQTLTARGTDEKEGKNEPIDLENASVDLAWDTSFVQKITEYTFADYKREFGQVVSAETDQDGYLEVRHEKLNAVCYYKNTSGNKEIVDTSRNSPYASGMPAKITLESIGLLLRNFEGGASLKRMQMFWGERVEPKIKDEEIYIENKEEKMIVRIGTDKDGNVVSASPWNEVILPMANEKETAAGTSTLSGVVIDAVTGSGVANASLRFVPKSAPRSEVTVKTDSEGAFRVELEADDYEITVSAEGYILETFTFMVEKGESYSGEQFTISPELSGKARIVLEWGAQPQDLDSHLTGSVDGGSSIHVYYGQKKENSGGNTAAELDLDDVDGNGPETTTIHNLDGVYIFSVVDFQGTGMMAAEGASVKIYMPGQEPVTVELSDSSGVDNVWEVCKIDHGRVEILNRAGSENNN